MVSAQTTSSNLLVTPSQELSAADVVNALQMYGLDSHSTKVVTNAVYEPTPRGCFGQSEGSIRKLVSIVQNNAAFYHSVETLATISAMLAPGASLVLVDRSKAGGDTMCRNLLLAGMTDAASSDTAASTTVTAKKPDWSVGAKFSISKKAKPSPAGPTAAQTKAPAVTSWKLAMDQDDDLIDEDDLLDEDDLSAPKAKLDDCEVGAGGQKKACKNCTCGRAEGKMELTQDMLDNPKEGGCGSCALGDAFRCGSCPYLGMPAFTAGQKIVLDVTKADV
mmetsp:Transcript_6258/g.11945  ORF Transcript_6258/g.11945 Transcript_6258/m.11945 type:complete len:277 (-) Transcript_6258:401-1231(-)